MPRSRSSQAISAAHSLVFVVPLTALVLPIFVAPAAFALATDTVTGKVVGADGKPIPNATVYIAVFQKVGEFTPAATVTTDANGAFQVELAPAALPDSPETKNLGFTFYGIATVVVPGMGTVQKALTSRPSSNVFTLGLACTVTGTVVDENKKPLAGTRVVLRAWTPVPAGQTSGSPFDQPYLMTLPGLPDGVLSAVTNTEGKWTMDGLPGTGKASFDATGSGRFMVTLPAPVATLLPGKTVALATMATRPASVLTGRVLDGETGKPAGGVRVMAMPERGGVGGNAVSGADGTYRLEELSGGVYTVTFATDRETRVAAPVSRVAVTEGKATALTDVMLTAGVVIEGAVTDRDTGKPVPGVSLAANFASARPTPSFLLTTVSTDANGHFRVVAPPGKVEITPRGLPNGYLLEQNQTQALTLQKGESKSLTFTVQKGLSAEGTVVSTEGTPLPGIHVRVLGANDFDFSYSGQILPVSDAGGKWRVDGLNKNAQGYRIVVDPEWEVVTPAKQFPLPASGGAPLTVTVKRRTTLVFSGRVVSTTSEPLPGAQVNFYASAFGRTTGGGPSQRNETLRTDANGQFKVTNLLPDEKPGFGVSLDGYKYRSGGIQTKTAEGITVSDIVMVGLSGKVSGQVVRPGAKGKVPVAGAYVWSLDGDDAAVTTTDADGKFTLAQVPSGAVEVTATSGAVFGSASSRAVENGAAPVPITLALTESPAPAPSPARTAALLTTVADGLKGRPGMDRSVLVSRIAETDPDAAFALAKASHSDGIVPDGVIATIIEARAKTDPARAMVWASPQLAAFKYDVVRCRVEGELAIALALAAPAQAARMYAAAVADGKDADSLTINRARMIAAAALLRNGDAAHHLLRLKQSLALTPRAKADTARSALIVARGDIALADSLISDSSVPLRSEYYAEMANRLVKTSPTGAERYLNKLTALKTELSTEKAKADPETRGSLETLNYYLSDVTLKVIDAIGPGDPHGALVLARAYATNSDNGWLALGLAARVQSKADAPQVWQEAERLLRETQGIFPASLARLAALAESGGDAASARSLWGKAKSAMALQDYRTPEGETFALQAARFDPALARMVGERNAALYLHPGPGGQPSLYQAMQSLVAFAAVDPEEAIARLATLPKGSNDGSDDGLNGITVSGSLAILKLLGLSPRERAAVTVNDLLRSAWEN